MTGAQAELKSAFEPRQAHLDAAEVLGVDVVVDDAPDEPAEDWLATAVRGVAAERRTRPTRPCRAASGPADR